MQPRRRQDAFPPPNWSSACRPTGCCWSSAPAGKIPCRSSAPACPSYWRVPGSVTRSTSFAARPNGCAARIRATACADGTWRLSARWRRTGRTRVLMLAEASRAVDPRTGGPARWLTENDVPSPVVLLTPKARGNWSSAGALAAQSGVLVLPADEQGLLSLAQRIQAAELEPSVVVPATPTPTQFDRWQGERFTWLSQASPARAVRDNLIATMRAMLGGDEFRLLVGVAAFPQVRLDLMATLDRRLHPSDTPSAQRTRLLTLGRLVWVKEGIIPDWLREDLLRALPPPELREVRERWMELLSDAPAPGEATSALTIHLAAGAHKADAVQGDGLFLSFMQGEYDLPAPLRFVRLAGLWRAPDRTELIAAALGVAVAVLALFTDIDLAAYAERCLRAWDEFVRDAQRAVPWPEQASLAMAFLPAVSALISTRPVRRLPALSLRVLAALGALQTTLMGWLGISFPPSFDVASAAQDLMAPLILGGGGAVLILWQQRAAQRSADDALNILQQSRGTSLADTPTMLVLLWLFIAGWLGWAIMPDQISISVANASLIALACLGLSRACLISWLNARLQHPFSPPSGVARDAAWGLVLGQVIGAAVAWMAMTNAHRNLGFSPVNYPFAMWHVTHGCMLFGCVVGLSATLRHRGTFQQQRDLLVRHDCIQCTWRTRSSTNAAHGIENAGRLQPSCSRCYQPAWGRCCGASLLPGPWSLGGLLPSPRSPPAEAAL